jgi:putative nucleotidyltransferase with HDIG domain
VSVTELVTALSGARRAVQLYPPSHPAFQEAIGTLIGAVQDETGAGPLVLNVHQGRLYHESLVLSEDIPGADAVAESFETRHIESMTFAPGFSRGDAVGLVEVLSLRPRPDLDPESELSSRGVASVTLALLADEDAEEREERDRQRSRDRAVYNRLVSALRVVVRRMEEGGGLDIRETTSVMSTVLERMTADPAAVLALATIGGDDPRLYHALNTMIYAAALGNRMGLPPEGMESLALSALLHDIGKTSFELGDPSQHDAMVRMHSETGAEILQRLALEDPAPMLVAYEHHMYADGSGYPSRSPDYVPHPFSRIITIADRYENLCGGSSAAAAVTPDKGIVRILREAGSLLDPFLARLFASALGVFPVGSLVRLADHSVGVVVRPGADAFAPVVRLSFDPDGNELPHRPDVDLSESEVRIVEVVAPESLNTKVADRI